MYNLDGTYHEQQAINMDNFKIEYIQGDKIVNGVVQPSKPIKRELTPELVNTVKDRINNISKSENDDIRYSISELDNGKSVYDYPFAKCVDAISNGTYTDHSNDVLVREDTPKWMTDLSYNNHKMLMTESHVKNVIGIGKVGHQHDVSIEILRALPYLIENPICAFEYKGDGTIIAFLNATDKNGMILIASIKPYGEGYYTNVDTPSNFVTSTYGKRKVVMFFDKVLNNGKLIYSKNALTKKDVVRTILGLQSSNNYSPHLIYSVKGNDGYVKYSLSENEDDYGYHYGSPKFDYTKKSETLFSRIESRSTGAYGTGTYFTSNGSVNGLNDGTRTEHKDIITESGAFVFMQSSFLRLADFVHRMIMKIVVF